MSSLRRAARKDANHHDVVDVLTAFGVLVVDVSGTACGCDLFAYSQEAGWRCLEVKDGSKPPSARRLTDIERTLAERCAAIGAPHHVVLTREDALAVMGKGEF